MFPHAIYPSPQLQRYCRFYHPSSRGKPRYYPHWGSLRRLVYRAAELRENPVIRSTDDYSVNTVSLLVPATRIAMLPIQLHRVSKTSHIWLAITLTHVNGFWYSFGRNVTNKVGNQKTLYYMLPQLTCASVLPDKTGKHENCIFHLNAAYFFTKKHETVKKISPGQSWTTLHCQNDRVGAPDRT